MDDQRKWQLSLVLPAFNEEAGIRQAVVEADQALSRFCRDYEILVVDDGSRDTTARIVRDLANDFVHVRLLRHETNRGYGSALRTGFSAARFERIAFTDADCQLDLADLHGLIELTDKHPIVVGWRIDRKDRRLRCCLSKGYNALAQLLFDTGVRDVDCALKVFRREALAKIQPDATGYFINTEMLTRARQLSFDVAEIGVRHRPRLHGESKVSLSDVPRTLKTMVPFWWSQVAFPGGASSETKTENSRRRTPIVKPSELPQKTQKDTTKDARIHEGIAYSIQNSKFKMQNSRLLVSLLPALVLFALASVLFLSRLSAPLLEPQEPRYAEIPRQMLVEGRLIVPVLHGEPYLDKPPLLYWLVMASYRIFGVQDWAARLIPGLAGVLTILVTYWWGRRAFGQRAGFLAALLLCLMPGFVYYGRMLTFDGLLALFVTMSLAAGHAAVTAPSLRWRWWHASALACGLGLLTKGPVALVLVGAPLLLHQALDNRAARIELTRWLAWLGIAVGLAAPWFIAVAVADGGFAQNFFWRHHVLRFFSPFDHDKPSWFFVPGLLIGLLPWTLLLPGFIVFLARRSRRAGRRRPAALGFCLLVFVCGFSFFSAAGCKRPVYILPVLPPLALALGCYLHQKIARPSWSALWQRTSALARSTALLVLGGGGCVAATAGAVGILRPEGAAALTVAGLGGVLTLGLVRRRLSWLTSMAVTSLALVLAVQHLQPAYNRRFALRGSLRNHAGSAVDGSIPVLCYPQRWDSVSFYMPNADVRVFPRDQKHRLLQELRARPESLLLVRSGAIMQELLRDMPENVEFVSNDRRPGAVTVGWVRARGLPPPEMWAGR